MTTAIAIPEEREKLTKKALTADHPTWCPGCGDFAVLAAAAQFIQTKMLMQDKKNEPQKTQVKTKVH